MPWIWPGTLRAWAGDGPATAPARASDRSIAAALEQGDFDRLVKLRTTQRAERPSLGVVGCVLARGQRACPALVPEVAHALLLADPVHQVGRRPGYLYVSPGIRVGVILACAPAELHKRCFRI